MRARPERKRALPGAGIGLAATRRRGGCSRLGPGGACAAGPGHEDDPDADRGRYLPCPSTPPLPRSLPSPLPRRSRARAHEKQEQQRRHQRQQQQCLPRLRPQHPRGPPRRHPPGRPQPRARLPADLSAHPHGPQQVLLRQLPRFLSAGLDPRPHGPPTEPFHSTGARGPEPPGGHQARPPLEREAGLAVPQAAAGGPQAAVAGGGLRGRTRGPSTVAGRGGPPPGLLGGFLGVQMRRKCRPWQWAMPPNVLSLLALRFRRARPM